VEGMGYKFTKKVTCLGLNCWSFVL
jgi:hypothetical protein